MAELYIIGSVVGGTDFEETEQLYCKWKVVSERNNMNVDTSARSSHWMHVNGRLKGITQQATAQFDHMLLWAHPIDVHFAFTSTVGWPRFFVEVWHVDEYDRHRLKGYGTCMVPTSPGTHSVECVTWRPAEGASESLFDGLLTPRLQFADADEVLLGHEKRQHQWGETSGSVHLELSILCRGLAGKNLRL
jgi:B9 domain-containing protein 2